MPRSGKLDDKAHPPIHPVRNPSLNRMDRSEQRLFELITRHFLAQCSTDATCASTKVTLKIGEEYFGVSGQSIEIAGYLEVYSMYEKVGDNVLPKYLTEKGTRIPLTDLKLMLR